MTLAQRAAVWFAAKAFGPGVTELGTYSLADPAFAEALRRLGDGTYSGRTVDDESAMSLSTVWTCVRVLAETVGSLPLAMFSDDGKGSATKIVDHDLYPVIAVKPNDDMTSQEMFESKVTNLGLRGNGYSIIERRPNGDALSLYPVAARRVTPRLNKVGDIEYEIIVGGKKEIFPSDRVWHVKGFGSDGLVGLSPLGFARQSMGLGLTLEEFAARFFANGARMSGVYKIPQWLTDEQRKRTKEILAERYAGVENAGKTGLLEGGMGYETLSVPPEDAQFLQSREWQAKEIFRIYRIPPHMAGDLSQATFSNIEQQSLDFVTYTLLPYLVRFERSFSARVLKPADRGRIYMRFNVEGLLRADATARSKLYSTLLQNGAMSRNEVRALENRPRSDAPGMDDYTVQTNMTVVQLLEAIGRAQAAPPGAKP